MTARRFHRTGGCGRTGRTRHSGAGLVEVLVALLVFSVGILAVTAMQLAAKRSAFEATQRSIATSLARDIIERIRTNPGEVGSYVVSELGESAVTYATDCNTSSCTPAELAQLDIFEWNALLQGASEQIDIDGVATNAGGLVDSRACITAQDGRVTVTIAWRGMTELADQDASDCGKDSGLYGDENRNRRLLVMSTFIRTG